MNKYIYFIFLLIISFALYLLEQNFMFTNGIDDRGGSSITIIVVLMLLIPIITMVLSRKNIIRDKLSKKFIILMVFIYIISLIYSLFYPFGSRYIYGSIILPLLVFYFISIYSHYFKNDNIIIWGMTFVAIMLSYYFISNYSNNMMYNTEIQNNGSYGILYLTPFMLCHKNKVIRVILLIMVSIVVMLSLKRGGFLALIVGVLVYFYISQVKIKKKKFKIFGIFIVLLGIIALTYFIIYINENVLSGMLFNRIEETSNSGGSGRLDIYKYFIKVIGDSSIHHLIFGHGFWGSTHAGEISITCHNDLLEMLIDYGIIGLALYISFLISLVKLCRRMIENKHEYSPAMGASIVIFLINSMVSHIWIYFWFLTEFTLFWGFIISSQKKIYKYHHEKNNARLRNPS